jgi:peroxiredoxin
MDFQAAGVQLLAVGLGRAEHAARYCGKLAPSMTCFAATSNKPYYLFGLRQSTLGEAASNAFNLARATIKAIGSVQVQGAETGDRAMMPGTFIVDRAGVIRYAYYSAYAGDDPAIPDLLAALRSLKDA